MRYTKAAHVRFLGDAGLGKQYVTHARTLLGKLVHTAIEGGGQLVAARRHTLPDGTAITTQYGGAVPVITIDTSQTKREQLLDVYVALTHRRISPSHLHAIVIGAFGKENLLASARTQGYAPSALEIQTQWYPRRSFNYPYRYRGNLYMVETVHNQEWGTVNITQTWEHEQYVYMPGDVARTYTYRLPTIRFVIDSGYLPWSNREYPFPVGTCITGAVCNEYFVFVACTEHIFEGGFLSHQLSDLVRTRQRIDVFVNDGSNAYAGSWFGEGSGLGFFGQEGYADPYLSYTFTYHPSLAALPDGLASITVFKNHPLPSGYKPAGLKEILSPDRRAVLQIRRFDSYFERVFTHVASAAVAANKEHVFVFVRHYTTSDGFASQPHTTVYRYTHTGSLVDTTEITPVSSHAITPPAANNLFVYTYAGVDSANNGVLQVRRADTLDILREVPAELVRDMLAFGEGGQNRAYAIHDYDNMFQ